MKEKKEIGRRERRKQKTNHQLKAATEALLVEEGYDALTIQKITDRADLARATFYLHFKDVEEAVWAVLADHFTQLGQVMWQVEGVDPAQRRYQKFANVFQYIKAHAPLMRVVFGERGHIKLVQRSINFMAADLASDIASGRVARLTQQPLEFETHFYAGAVLQIVNWWLQTGTQQSPEEMAHMLMETIQR